MASFYIATDYSTLLLFLSLPPPPLVANPSMMRQPIYWKGFCHACTCQHHRSESLKEGGHRSSMTLGAAIKESAQRKEMYHRVMW